MKKIIGIMVIVLTLIGTVTLLANYDVEQKGNWIIITFYNGPPLIEGDIVTCPNSSNDEVLCQEVRIQKTNYTTPGMLHAGDEVNIFIHTDINNPNNGVGLVNVTLTGDVFFDDFGGIEFEKNLSYPEFVTYSDWENYIDNM